MTVYRGIANIKPVIPNKIPPVKITKKISSGCDFTEFEKI